jgi:2-iminobutanoate/2-iminopropanoate deaminase
MVVVSPALKAIMKTHNPPTIAPPAALYVHGAEVPSGARWLFISGQVGVHPDGRPGAGALEQAELVWKNIEAILASAGMALSDIVKVTTYSVDAAHLPALKEVRDRVLAGHLPASTLLVVKALARPEWLLEVEAYAARA